MVTFDKLLKIIQDTGKTDYQKAADLHSLIGVASVIEAPKTTPGKRRGRKPKDANGAAMPPADAGGMFGGEPPA